MSDQKGKANQSFLRNSGANQVALQIQRDQGYHLRGLESHRHPWQHAGPEQEQVVRRQDHVGWCGERQHWDELGGTK